MSFLMNVGKLSICRSCTPKRGPCFKQLYNISLQNGLAYMGEVHLISCTTTLNIPGVTHRVPSVLHRWQHCGITRRELLKTNL